MYQIDVSTAVSTQPTSTALGTPGYFTDGNAALGQAATVVPAEFLNSIMLELVNTITGAGLTLSKSSFNQLYTAIRALSQGGGATYAVDTGSANTYQVAYTPAITAVVDGMKLRFKAKTANTGASTFSPNGLAAAPIYGGAHSALLGGEIVANSDVEVVWNSSLNSGNGAWVILESTGGFIEAATPAPGENSAKLATTSALMWGLYQGKGVQRFTSGGTWTCPAGVTTVWLSGVGGGGGGGGSNGTSGAGEGGGGGSWNIRVPVTVTPGTVYTVTIGGGGSGGANGANGGAGGQTSFGSLFTAPGGQGGSYTGSTYGGGGQAGTNSIAGAAGRDGFGTIPGDGGWSPFGMSQCRTATPGGSGFGYGGGGAPANSTSGAAGGNGLLIIEW
ncbi:hypothetical protein [Burkholderia stagnalis]|uniref:glycine-rich domain-containing protein n=1 Tax=Burkholderia stagnalis TaxID=1503054 RepID=UPI000AEF8FAF|nr:hypothetical protein [Burkholderia stagnalis]